MENENFKDFLLQNIKEKRLKKISTPLKIDKIPDELYDFDFIEEITLKHNYINSLSPKVGNLHSLKYLELIGTKITHIPNELFDLTNLVRLVFTASPIEEISSSIGKLVNLKRLGLTGTSIQQLPKEIMHLQKLRYLELANTPLKKIPESILDLPNLIRVDISKNQEIFVPLKLRSKLRIIPQ